MRNILIQGVNTLLGSYFAASVLISSDDLVFCLPSPTRKLSEEAVQESVSHACRQISGQASVDEKWAELGSLLRTVSDGCDLIDIRMDEIWYFAYFRQYTQAQLQALQELLSALPKTGAREFNYVSPLPVARDELEEKAQRNVALACAAHGIEYRVFRTSLLLGVWHPALEVSQGDFLQFLAVLHSLKSEIEERWSQYFDFRTLRCQAPECARINLMDAREAAKLLLRIARNGGAFGVSYCICSPEASLLTEVCERVGEAYGLGLLTADDERELNAIDRSFHSRLSEFQYWFTATPDWDCSESYRVAGCPAQSAVLDEETQAEIFQENRRSQDAAREARSRRVADLPARLTRKILVRNGFELAYYTGGTSGPVVVLLNALGQGLRYWRRLMDLLMERYRVIIWEPRGLVSLPPPFGLDQQVLDLDSILRQEDVGCCYFVAWCTGPKMAVDFCLQQPSVVHSMVFLNSNFKCVGREQLDTSYAQALDSLNRSVVRKPAMAASVMQSFQSLNDEGEIKPPQASDVQLSVRVLSLTNADLRSDVIAPFQNEETTINYAHQLLEFATHDSKQAAGQVTVPVLLIAAEYDQVASPAMSNTAAEWFPNAHLVHVHGATHYCLYDRPDLIMDLIVDFFEHPDELPLVRSLETEMAGVK